MSVEFGFNLISRDEYNKTGTVKPLDVDLPYACGRSGAESAWGRYFYDGNDEVTPVFNRELDGKTRTYDNDYIEKYKYTDFEDFSRDMQEAIDEMRRAAYQELMELRYQVADLTKTNQELRQLQKQCTADQSYAFDRWNDEIAQNNETIRDIQREIDDFNDENYSQVRANVAQEVLNSMNKYVNDTRYYVIPYYSY